MYLRGMSLYSMLRAADLIPQCARSLRPGNTCRIPNCGEITLRYPAKRVTSWRARTLLHHGVLPSSSLFSLARLRARARRALSLSRSRSISNAHTSTHGTHECVQVLQAATEAMAHSARRNAEPAPYVVFDQRFRRRRDDAVDAFKVRASLTLFQAAAEANGDAEVLARCA